jgi:hypothetical protein
MIVMKFMMKMAAMTTMMAGPRTVGLGCISLVQRLDERSKASFNNRPIEWYAIIYITNTRKQGANCRYLNLHQHNFIEGFPLS